VAVLAFGLNSAAYVAEIVRSGIMSIDNGQFEASASLGLNYPKTLLSVILPQAFKNGAAGAGERVHRSAERTSVAGYIAVIDLTKGAILTEARPTRHSCR